MAVNSSLSDEEIIDKLINKEIKFYRLDELLGDEKKATLLRLKAVEKISKKKFIHINKFTISPKNARPNIENMIGSIQVPLGIAGPVQVCGEYAKGDFFLPIATTEGALTASVNRGCSVINNSEGASVCINKSGQTRSILFKFKNIEKIKTFFQWIDHNFSKLKKVSESKSNFLELISINKFVVGNSVWLRLTADTKDAMGMNMITLAAKTLGEYIESNFTGAEFVSTSGNICMDKKPSALNLAEGRGKSLLAEVFIPNSVVEKYLKTTPEKMVDVNYRKNLLGSALAGSYGFNANFANIAAAIFLATGQDLGHIVDGSHGFTTMELVDDKLHAIVTLSSLQLGTIGGGTNLETQKECLELLGVHGSGDPPGANASKFAEIVAAAVLAGEISLIGALAAKHLVKAHMELNR
ncbi:hydroxymethylglutaryl-CoA reductase (NADPH) [Candidatus Woesearchaeota archaeon]|nr:hydroxymethylglutaryl-CoA reductase (NADPH) [Candidatus Woesearchaeota archaeon]